MKRTNILLTKICLFTALIFFGCEPAQYDTAPDDAPSSEAFEPGVPAGASEPNGVSDSGDDTGSGKLGIKVDVGDGVDVQVGERVGVDVDREGVDVDVNSAE